MYLCTLKNNKLMKSENNKGIDINEMALSIKVDDEVIGKVRTGEVTHIALDINESNYRQILENFDGNLVLVTDELPETFHGYPFYRVVERPFW